MSTQAIRTPFAAPFGVITRRTTARLMIAVVPADVDDDTLDDLHRRLMWDASLAKAVAATVLATMTMSVPMLLAQLAGINQLVNILAVTAVAASWNLVRRWGTALAPRIGDAARAAYPHVIHLALMSGGGEGRLARTLVAAARADLPDTTAQMIRCEVSAVAGQAPAQGGLTIAQMDGLAERVDALLHAAGPSQTAAAAGTDGR